MKNAGCSGTAAPITLNGVTFQVTVIFIVTSTETSTLTFHGHYNQTYPVGSASSEMGVKVEEVIKTSSQGYHMPQAAGLDDYGTMVEK
jgi:hypothetical protein